MNDGPKNQGFCDCAPLDPTKEKSELRVVFSVQKKKCYPQNTQVFIVISFKRNNYVIDDVRVLVRTGSGLCSRTTSPSVKRIPVDVLLMAGTSTGVRMQEC